MSKHKAKHGEEKGRAKAEEQPEQPAVAEAEVIEEKPSAPLDEVANLRKALDDATQQVAAMKDQMLRAMADLDNSKKRLEREHQDFKRYACESVVRRLLPVLDGLEQALAAEPAPNQAEVLHQGMRLVHQQMLDALKQEHVEPIEALGKPFDPHLHEAVMQVEVEDPEQDNRVVEQLQRGYTMHGRLLRSAMVKVAKNG